ncbi:MAG: gliding motility-associated C-terminal domain-containing protein [Candidatus Cyclobacteriaceae bacterium M2_1C_046]
MKLIYALLFFLCLPLGDVSSQNLIPNPGFEEYKYLSCNPRDFIEDFVEHWSQPLGTSTDYWHESQYFSDDNCNRLWTKPSFPANSGQAMIGIFTYVYIGDNAKSNYREYIQTKLKNKTKEGQVYNVEFFYRTDNKYDWINNNLGFYFSTDLIDEKKDDSPSILSYNPQFKIDSILQKSDNWIKVSSCFFSEKSYEFVTIGNFYDDTVNIIQGTDKVKGVAGAYYYLDDISITELEYNLTGLPKAYDFCYSDPGITVSYNVQGATGYSWSNGSTGNSADYNDRKDGEHFVDIHFNECTYRHHFEIDYKEDIEIGADTTLCYQESIILNTTHSIKKYQWSTGAVDRSIIVSQPGIYTLQIPDESCYISDTVRIDFEHCPGFIPNVITPNQDQYNEFFKVENIESRRWYLNIYNRWGIEVYTDDNYQNTWNGYGLDPGIYYYHLNSPDLNKSVKGWVQVIR